MELEWLLLKHQRSNVALITGLAGSGKTLLARLVSVWWRETGLIQNFEYHCLRDESLDHAVCDLKVFDEARKDLPPEQRRLYIIDHLDAATVSTWNEDGNAKPTWQIEDKELFSTLIQTFLGGMDLLILISRSDEKWLGIPKTQLYYLGGLANYHANELASTTLQSLGMGDFVEDIKEKPYIEYLTSRLLYNPSAVKFLLTGMKESAKEWPSLAKLLIAHHDFLPGYQCMVPTASCILNKGSLQFPANVSSS